MEGGCGDEDMLARPDEAELDAQGHALLDPEAEAVVRSKRCLDMEAWNGCGFC